MAYTTPPTFNASDPLAAAELNVLSDDITYIYSGQQGTTFSGVQVRRAASQSIPNETDREINFDTENWDVGGWYSSGTDVVVPAGAIPDGGTSIGVLVVTNIKYAADTTGRRKITLLKNGTAFGSWNIGAAGGGDPTDIAFTEVTTVIAADVLTMEAWQSSGGSLNVSEARMTIVRLGVAS